MTTDLVMPENPWACPGGRLVLPYSAPRDKWLEARRQFICSTDYSNIFGATSYDGQFGVWAEKKGLVPPSDTTVAQARGLYLERGIAEWFRDHVVDYPIELRRLGLMQSLTEPWLASSFDFRSVCPDGPCLTEIKSQGDDEDWSGNEIPVHIQIQDQIELFVSGRHHIHTWALGPRFTPIVRRMDRSPDLIRMIIEDGRAWHQRHIVDGEQPEPDGRSLGTIQRMYGWSSGKLTPVEISADLRDSLKRHRELGEQLKDLGEERKEIMARLTVAAGPAEELRYGGDTVAYLKATKKIVGADAKFVQAHRELVAPYTEPSTAVNVSRMVAEHPELIEDGALRYERRLRVL